MTFHEVKATEASERLEHVPSCCCRYVADPATTDDVKLVDQRCVAAYLVPEVEAQKALLKFRSPDGRYWLAAAVLTPMRTVGGDEERPYVDDDEMRLIDFTLVDAPEGD